MQKELVYIKVGIVSKASLPAYYATRRGTLRVFIPETARAALLTRLKSEA